MSKTSFKKLKKVLGEKIVGLDADQILILSIIPVVEKVREDLDESFSIRHIKGWNSVRQFAEEKLGWSNKKANEYEHKVWNDPEILIKAPPVPGAKEFTKSLVESDINFYVITSRVPSLRETTAIWFNKNMPWVSEEQIRINKNGDLAGLHFKHKEVKKLSVDLHIDDSPEHARLILENTSASVILASNYEGAEDLDHHRLTKISRNDRLPNMHDVYEHLVSD